MGVGIRYHLLLGVRFHRQPMAHNSGCHHGRFRRQFDSGNLAKQYRSHHGGFFHKLHCCRNCFIDERK